MVLVNFASFYQIKSAIWEASQRSGFMLPAPMAQAKTTKSQKCVLEIESCCRYHPRVCQYGLAGECRLPDY